MSSAVRIVDDSTKIIKIYPLYKLVCYLSGCIYELAPNFEPRKIDIIMKKFVEKVKNDEDIKTLGQGSHTFYFFKNNKKDMEKKLREILWGIPEFLELNLSQREFEAGINPTDENRGVNIVFTSRYGSTINAPEDDFIDLDAVIQNVMYALKNGEND